MKKARKQIWALVFMCIMVFMMLPTKASAAEKSDEKAAVYVQVPGDWEKPCVWAWNEDGTNAFESWPGEEMDADAANEGWYYIWLPVWANHVIINANAGSVQTAELVLDGKDAWIKVTAADSAEISYEKQTQGDTPEYVEKFAVHAKVDVAWKDPYLWAWSAPDGKNAFASWPGKGMSLDEASGWYTAKVPVWVNSIIVNANEGKVQTEDISIDAAEVWVTIAEDGTNEFSYIDPDKAAVEDVTVHVIVPKDWENANLWAWSAPDGTNVYTTWPGEALEEDEDGWMKKVIPGWVNSIIVNANEGSVQTTDISVEKGKEVWLVVNGPEDYQVNYEKPEIANTEAAAPEETSATETPAPEETSNTETPAPEDTSTTEAPAPEESSNAETPATEEAKETSTAASTKSVSPAVVVIIILAVAAVVVAAVVIIRKRAVSKKK